MTVLVQSNSLKVSKALQRFVEDQAAKVRKLGKGVVQIQVYLESIAKKSNDPHANKVTYKVSIPGKDVVVTKNATNMYDAIVDATDSAARQMRKLYERRRTLQRRLAH
jgi:ribosomal subunit interface protein